MAQKNWQDILKRINNGVHEERQLLKRQLHHKLEELQKFKSEMNGLKETTLSISSSREDRIRRLEKKHEEARRTLVEEQSKTHSLEEDLRTARIRLEQLERENISLRQELEQKVNQVNQLRLELLPGTGLSQRSARHRKLEKLEDTISDTQQFYAQINSRIDRILKS